MKHIRVGPRGNYIMFSCSQTSR